MLKSRGQHALARSQYAWLLRWTMCMCALPAVGWADSLPASLRACASEQDSLRRLICYDREVARFPPEPGPSPGTEPPPHPPASDTPPVPLASTAPVVASPAPAPDNQLKSTPTNSDHRSEHLSAHVVSIDRAPNELVLRLDNGQVWQEVQSTSGDLSLQVGDAVKIDKHLGSYWLSGPHVSGMKVRQKT